VSAKDKDDLQAAIALLKSEDWPVALQFTNYR
jgi:cyclic-di-GMP-binding protein